MYGRTAYFKYFELAMYLYIHFVGGTIYPWLYASTSTVRIWIDITNVPPTDFINLASICILYNLYCQFQMVDTNVLWHTWEIWLYACTETVLIGIEVTNIWCTIQILLVAIWILYSSCTDVYQFQMVGTYVLWDTLDLWLRARTEIARFGIEVINVPFTISILLVVIRIL